MYYMLGAHLVNLSIGETALAPPQKGEYRENQLQYQSTSNKRGDAPCSWFEVVPELQTENSPRW
jgi:hypothetical protein